MLLMCMTVHCCTVKASAMSERWHRHGTASAHIKIGSRNPFHYVGTGYFDMPSRDFVKFIFDMCPRVTTVIMSSRPNACSVIA